jgi:hypothetical protein
VVEGHHHGIAFGISTADNGHVGISNDIIQHGFQGVARMGVGDDFHGIKPVQELEQV